MRCTEIGSTSRKGTLAGGNQVTMTVGVVLVLLLGIRPTLAGDDPPGTLDDEQLQAASAMQQAEPATELQALPPGAGTVKEAPALLPELPSDDGKSIAVTAPHAASFQGITPGKSTMAEVIERLGEAPENMEEGDNVVWGYQIGPFPRVEVMLTDELVTSVVIHLPNPGTREEIANELKLGRFRPLRVRDDQGLLLGEAYPERGLLFAFGSQKADQQAPKVEHVVLEPVTAEPFMLRAEETAEVRFADRLSDLKIAVDMDPDIARAHWMRAELAMKCGRLQEAREAIEAAVALEPDNVPYQVTAATIYFQLGRRDDALKQTSDILASQDLAALDKTRAQVLHGRLLATGPEYDYKKAMQETVAAIKEAAQQVRASQGHERLRWRSVLVDGELGRATIISHGRWEDRHSVVPQWLASAE
jgi:hypothetical protein